MDKFYFNEEILHDIKNRINALDIIGKFVAFKRQGNRLVGLCPFHKEKTPSFSLNNTDGLYHCFGCGKGGDVFTFLMESQNYTFADAVAYLAKETGVTLPQKNATKYNNSSQYNAPHTDEIYDDTLIELNHKICAIFQKCLYEYSGRNALDYLYSRNLTDEDIKSFSIGFAPDSKEQMMEFKKLFNNRNQLQLLEQIDIINKGKFNEHYPKFRLRIVFPIFDRQNRIIGFGGRAINDQTPKYLNSSDNQIFHKKYNLYGQETAFNHIRKLGDCIICEGYMDVISLQKSGFKGAVAPLGTSITTEQIIQLVKRIKANQKIIICFDGDNAGKMAAIRAAHKFLPYLRADTKVVFVHMPIKEDPDSIISNFGAAKMQAMLNNHEDIFDLLWQTIIAKNKPIANISPNYFATLRSEASNICSEIKDFNLRTEVSSFFKNKIYKQKNIKQFKKKTLDAAGGNVNLRANHNNNATVLPPLPLGDDIVEFFLVFALIFDPEIAKQHFDKIEKMMATMDGELSDFLINCCNYLLEKLENSSIKNESVESITLLEVIKRFIEKDSAYKDLYNYINDENYINLVTNKLQYLLQQQICVNFFEGVNKDNIKKCWLYIYDSYVTKTNLEKDIAVAKAKFKENMSQDNWNKIIFLQQELEKLIGDSSIDGGDM